MRATSIDRNPSRATSTMIAKFQTPRDVPRAQLSSSLTASAAVILGCRAAKRHPPTGGTAVPSRNGVMSCKYRNRRIERSSATRPLADWPRSAAPSFGCEPPILEQPGPVPPEQFTKGRQLGLRRRAIIETQEAPQTNQAA